MTQNLKLNQDLGLNRYNKLNASPQESQESQKGSDFTGLVVIGLFLVILGAAGLTWVLLGLGATW